MQHWIHGGETKLSNLLQLCHFHHHLVHEGGFGVERAENGFVFSRSDGRVIERVPLRPGGNGSVIAKDNHRLGIEIGPDHLRAQSGGEPFDLGLAVEDLLSPQIL